jgi:hypothetical protein
MQGTMDARMSMLERRIAGLERDIENRPHLWLALGMVIRELELEMRASEAAPARAFGSMPVSAMGRGRAQPFAW